MGDRRHDDLVDVAQPFAAAPLPTIVRPINFSFAFIDGRGRTTSSLLDRESAFETGFFGSLSLILPTVGDRHAVRSSIAHRRDDRRSLVDRESWSVPIAHRQG